MQQNAVTGTSNEISTPSPGGDISKLSASDDSRTHNLDNRPSNDLKSFIKWVKEITHGIKDCNVICERLKGANFKSLPAGEHKTAFLHSDYPNWVVKVFTDQQGWYECHSTVGMIPKIFQPFWLKNVFVSRRFVIQPFVKCDQASHTAALSQICKQLNIRPAIMNDDYDVWDFNTALYAGKPVIFDFTVYSWDKYAKYYKRSPRITPRPDCRRR